MDGGRWWAKIDKDSRHVRSICACRRFFSSSEAFCSSAKKDVFCPCRNALVAAKARTMALLSHGDNHQLSLNGQGRDRTNIDLGVEPRW